MVTFFPPTSNVESERQTLGPSVPETLLDLSERRVWGALYYSHHLLEEWLSLEPPPGIHKIRLFP